MRESDRMVEIVRVEMLDEEEKRENYIRGVKKKWGRKGRVKSMELRRKK